LWMDSGVSGVSGATLTGSSKIVSGSSVAAIGWAEPGPSYDNPMAVMVVGWSAIYGSTWSAVSSLLTGAGLSSDGYFGVTAVGVNTAGGGTATLPAVNQWINGGGYAGYQPLGVLILTPGPEPSTMVLAGLGGLSLWLLRRRK
jgi:hypothetical protein